MKAFDDFIKRRLLENFKDVFGGDNDNENEDSKNNDQSLSPNSQALAIWLNTVATNEILCQESLTAFFQNPHILGCLGEALKIVFRSLQ